MAHPTALDRTSAIVMADPDARSFKAIIRRILDEDIGSGDVTTMSLIPAGSRARGAFVAKSKGMVAGWEAVKEIYHCVGNVRLDIRIRDGERCGPGDTLATADGDASALLSAERTALNVLQRMSGIATTTAEFVHAVTGTGAVILDTRKTAPGIRILDKMAVKIGGGHNHRFGLDEMILIKENHIAVCGGVLKASEKARANDHSGKMVEIEVRTLEEFQEALTARPDRILLDNMDIGTLQKAVDLAKKRVPLEASGNISLKNIRKTAETGVEFISVGRLTHSVEALDVSFVLTTPPIELMQ